MELACSPVVTFRDTLVFKSSLQKEYRVEWGSSLGEGASGQIRRCVHMATGRTCALKVLPDNADSRHELLCWRACMPHPNIVNLLDVFKEDLCLANDYIRRPWIVAIMDIMAGGDLYFEVVRRQRFTESDAQFVGTQLMQVLPTHETMSISSQCWKAKL